MKVKILLVEDDINLGDVLRDYLELQEYEVTRAMDGVEGLEIFKSQPFDLLLLDVMLPRKDGFTLANEIRAIDQQIPLIFLTARGQMEDRVTGFKTGCDDYITKPFSSEELELRIGAILRRCLQPETNQQPESGLIKGIYPLGKYIFDSVNHELRIADKRISLTTKELDLMQVLYSNKNQLITREKTLKAVWGSDNYFIGRSMDVFITKLRKYLKDDPNISIVNIHGSGFRLEVKESD
ncbi:MAG: response regulator transcription factor [Bacteroidota bacterium]